MYAGADIKTAYGAKVYSKGDLVKENLTTDSNGAVILKNLHLGTYIIKEKQAFFNGVYSILEDKDGNIWLGTRDIGLFQLKKTGANHYSIHHFEHQTNDPYSLSSNSIYAIFQDSRNHIWIGCYGGGTSTLQ